MLRQIYPPSGAEFHNPINLSPSRQSFGCVLPIVQLCLAGPGPFNRSKPTRQNASLPIRQEKRGETIIYGESKVKQSEENFISAREDRLSMQKHARPRNLKRSMQPLQSDPCVCPAHLCTYATTTSTPVCLELFWGGVEKIFIYPLSRLVFLHMMMRWHNYLTNRVAWIVVIGPRALIR